jgi:hypothetical protein
MAALTAHSAELTSLLKSDQQPHKPGAEVAINIAFIALTTFSHCLGVKVRYRSRFHKTLGSSYGSYTARLNE